MQHDRRRHTQQNNAPSELWGEWSTLIKAADDALAVGLISKTVHDTLAYMTRKTASGLEVPVCAVPIEVMRVEIAPQERSAETVRRHLRELEIAGLIINTAHLNGHRGRSAVTAYGSDLTPLLAQADYLHDQHSSLKKARAERLQCVGEINSMRSRIARMIRTGVELPDHIANLWTALPRRIGAGMDRERLQGLIDTCRKIVAFFGSNPTKTRGLPHKNEGQSTYTSEYPLNRNYKENDEATSKQSTPRTDVVMEDAVELFKTAIEDDPELEEVAEAYHKAHGQNFLLELGYDLARQAGVSDRAVRHATKGLHPSALFALCLMVHLDKRVAAPDRWFWSMQRKCREGTAKLPTSLKWLNTMFKSQSRACSLT